VAFASITAGEPSGWVEYVRAWLEDRDPAYVLATEVNDLLMTDEGTEVRVDELIAALLARMGIPAEVVHSPQPDGRSGARNRARDDTLGGVHHAIGVS
jgi:hypothetical protein